MLLNLVAGPDVGKRIRDCSLGRSPSGKRLGTKELRAHYRRRPLPLVVGRRRGAPVALVRGMTNSARAGRPIDARGNRILRAAAEEFARHGFREGSPSRIARSVGVSERVVAQYFPTRQELFREVVRTLIVEQLRAAESWRVPSEGEWADRLVTWQRRFSQVMHRREGRALARWNREEFHAFPELAHFYRSELIDRAVSEVERLVGRGMGRELVENLLR